MKKFLQIFVGSALIIFCSRTIAFVVVVPTSPRTITESLIVANHHHHHHRRRRRHIKNTATLWAGNSNISDDDADENSNKMKSTTGNTNVGGLDGDMKTKLLTESIAPWRTLRLFFYGALGSGAFIGGLINGSGAIAASASPDFNLQTELINIGIDFGAVTAFGLLAKYDLEQQSELQGKVDAKIERKKEMKKIGKTMKERESILKDLELEITLGEDRTRIVKVSDLQAGAKQHMIIIAGPKQACRDALVGANILKMDFALSNVLVVPYDTGTKNQHTNQEEPKKGFSNRPSYETQPYIAKASGKDWNDYIAREIKDAVSQNGDSVKKDGVAIVVASNGNIIRRGVGTVPWRQMVEELQETTKSPADNNSKK